MTMLAILTFVEWPHADSWQLTRRLALLHYAALTLRRSLRPMVKVGVPTCTFAPGGELIETVPHDCLRKVPLMSDWMAR